MDIAKLKSIARALSFEETLTILALQAASCVNDMTSDYTQDPEYVKNAGLPSKAQLVEFAVDYITSTLPEMIDGSGEIPSAGTQLEDDTPLVSLIRDAVTHVYNVDGSLSVLKYTAR